MCGIIGYVGKQNSAEILVNSLQALEYRGYDSAGIAVLDSGYITVKRCEGKVSCLSEILDEQPVKGFVGLGHTRWATHGRPSEENAHPHRDCTHKIVVVHNGIIENYLSLKDALKDEGHSFQSDTDTEVIAHLIEKYYNGDLKAAVLKAIEKIQGSYSLGVIHADHPERMVAACHHSPLIIGHGENENFIASDIPAVLAHTREITHVHDSEIAEITQDEVVITHIDGAAVRRKPTTITWDWEMAQKDGFEHFMLKEIYEQPNAFLETIKARMAEETGRVYIKEMGLSDQDIRDINKIVIVSCGTSWHAGLIGRRYIEKLVKIPVSVEYASEFRYAEPLIDRHTLLVAISQSGETADTLAAVRESKRYNCKVVSICNVVGSTLTRESDGVIYTHAGPEIGVASTKAFTCQLGVLYLLALCLARIRRTISVPDAIGMMDDLKLVPEIMQNMFEETSHIERIARKYYRKRNFIYLGRGAGFAIALEGALKLKEISYIHAEGYHAGEMKHGPIALIDKNMPVVVLALKGRRYDKVVANIEEIKAREGKVIAIATQGDSSLEKLVDDILYVPDIPVFLTPILSVIPLQFLSYYIAVLRGCNVDQPRNLAKSVTVE